MLMFCWQAGPESVISVSVVFEISASVMCDFSLCGIPFQSSSPQVMLIMWFNEHGVRLSLHDVQFLSIWCVISVLVWFECLMSDFSPCVVWVQSLCCVIWICDMRFQSHMISNPVMCDLSLSDFQFLWCGIWGLQSLQCVISVSVAFSSYDVWFQFLSLSVLMMCDFSLCGLVLMMCDFRNASGSPLQSLKTWKLTNRHQNHSPQ